ncbi:hypothetical protein C8J56DRAFT_1027807 [Mycena floridula]|nr:hypothetical protein C8J56DRAFT_1027807 [Mycena floridula]
MPTKFILALTFLGAVRGFALPSSLSLPLVSRKELSSLRLPRSLLSRNLGTESEYSAQRDESTSLFSTDEIVSLLRRDESGVTCAYGGSFSVASGYPPHSLASSYLYRFLLKPFLSLPLDILGPNPSQTETSRTPNAGSNPSMTVRLSLNLAITSGCNAGVCECMCAYMECYMFCVYGMHDPSPHPECIPATNKCACQHYQGKDGSSVGGLEVKPKENEDFGGAKYKDVGGDKENKEDDEKD